MKKKKYTPPFAFALSWFEPEQWQELRATVDDLADLHDSYENWLADAERLVNRCSKQGQRVAKVRYEIAEWAAWCERHNLRKDGKARSQYAGELAKRLR